MKNKLIFSLLLSAVAIGMVIYACHDMLEGVDTSDAFDSNTELRISDAQTWYDANYHL